MALTIADVGKGARKGNSDKRNYKVTFDAKIQPPIDWAAGSGLSRPASITQGRSDCCVACAWSYYHWQIRRQQFSRVDLFARIALDPGEGAEIGTGGLAIVNQGQATQAALPDPIPETEQNMRNKAGITGAAELPWKEYQSFATDIDIDSVARSIGIYKGVVCGFYATNAGWYPADVPVPPTPDLLDDLEIQIKSGAVWGHALYLVDFHMHNNLDGTQEKCIIGATSWPELGLTEHHMRESYFTTDKAVFDSWTLIPTAAVESVMQKVSLKIPSRKAAVRSPNK